MAIESAALPKLLQDHVPEALFYIPATGPASRPRYVLKHDDTFVVLDSHGDIRGDPARQLTLRTLDLHGMVVNGHGDALRNTDRQLSNS